MRALQDSRSTYPDTLVSDAENGFRIRDDKELDVSALGCLQKVFLHFVSVGERQVQALAPSEEVRIVRDRISLGTACSACREDWTKHA